jgi:hypothetical protein
MAATPPGYFVETVPRATTTTPSHHGTTTATTNTVAFCAVGTRRLRPRARPAVIIQIANTTGNAFLGTAAGSTIASASLYHHLQVIGHESHPETVDITLADHPTTFVMLSPEENTKALLGADFIEDAGLVLNIAASSYIVLVLAHSKITF